MSIKRVLKTDSETFIKLEELNKYLKDNDLELIMTLYNGILYKTKGHYFKYDQEGDYPEILPPFFDGKYVECDEWGNTDFYQI